MTLARRERDWMGWLDKLCAGCRTSADGSLCVSLVALAASFVMSVLANRRRVTASGSISYMMPDLLRQLDIDYYRSALLLVARIELERLRQEGSRSTYIDRPSKTPLGAVPTADGAAAPEVSVASLPRSEPGKQRCE
jgi:hypothetical protein